MSPRRTCRRPRSRARRQPGANPASTEGVADTVEDATRLVRIDRLAGLGCVRLKELALALAQLRRDRHVHEDMQVAADARPPQVRHAPTAQAQLRSWLRSRLDLDLLVALDGGHLDACPEGGLSYGDVELVVELRCLPRELPVGRDVDGHVQAAGGPPARTDLALVRKADLVALVDARRNRDPELLAAFHAALAATGLAGLLDDPTLTTASRAGRHVDHLPEHRLADVPHLAPAVALGTRDGARARLGAGSAARVATLEHGKLDLLLRALDRLLEGDSKVVAEVGSGGRAPASGGAGCSPAEEGVEDVAEAPESGTEACPEPTLARNPRPAEQVVSLPALWVGQHLVRLVELLEPLRGRGVLVDVGVPLLRELAVGALDLGVARVAHYPQDFVIIAFRDHAAARLRKARPG